MWKWNSPLSSLKWKIPFSKSKKRRNQTWSRILNISSPIGDIWQKLNIGFSSIFGDFPPSINNCGHERKFFLKINKDHFQSLKKAESSFEVGFWISLLKPEIFKKNKIFIFHQFLVFLLILWFLFSKLVWHQTKYHRYFEKDHNRRENQDEATGEVGFEPRPLWATLFTKNWKESGAPFESPF